MYFFSNFLFEDWSQTRLVIYQSQMVLFAPPTCYCRSQWTFTPHEFLPSVVTLAIGNRRLANAV